MCILWVNAVMKMNKTDTEEYLLLKTQISVFLTSHGTKIAKQEEQMLMTCIQKNKK